MYSITFLVYTNNGNTYKEYANISEISISCNKEAYFRKEYERCKNDGTLLDDRENGRYSEMRWDYAYLEEDETAILDEEGYAVLFNWYKQEGIENIGYEDPNCYDEMIDKGPVGYYELLRVITQVAKRIQTEDFFLHTAGKRLPLIILDYESTWITVEATKEANIHEEANDYFAFLNHILL